MADKNAVFLTRHIGNTTYKVRVYLSETAEETMEDKILRLIRNDGLHDIKRDVANMLNEEVIVRPIRERLHQKQKHQTQQRQNGKKNRDSWER